MEVVAAARQPPDAVGPIGVARREGSQRAARRLAHGRDRITAAVLEQSGPAFSGDSLDQLERLASLLPSVKRIADDGAVLADMVASANTERETGGLTWNAQPKDVRTARRSTRLSFAPLRASGRRQAVLAC